LEESLYIFCLDYVYEITKDACDHLKNIMNIQKFATCEKEERRKTILRESVYFQLIGRRESFD